MTPWLWRSAGLVSLGLGAVGAFLPLLPTVPFVILAAFCFARGQPAWEARLLADPRFGTHIVRWRDKGAVSRKGKIAASVAFAVSSAVSVVAAPWPWLLATPIAAVLCLSWLWTRPEA